MKKIYLIIGLIILLLNTLCGLIFTEYSTFNLITSNVIVLINTLLLYFMADMKISDAFKITFSFLFPFFGLISFILALVMKNKIENNLCLIGILMITLIQVAFLSISKLIKK
jgi:hypothetical protein